MKLVLSRFYWQISGNSKFLYMSNQVNSNLCNRLINDPTLDDCVSNEAVDEILFSSSTFQTFSRVIRVTFVGFFSFVFLYFALWL